jgi:hypothetical protein
MDNEKVERLSWTSCRSFLDSISSASSRAKGGRNAQHVMHHITALQRSHKGLGLNSAHKPENDGVKG